MAIRILAKVASQPAPTPLSRTFEQLANALLDTKRPPGPVEWIEIAALTATGEQCRARLLLRPDGELQIDFARRVM